jgi:glutathione synthase/RimK-type ligase-like ATP-grasp enzyme
VILLWGLTGDSAFDRMAATLEARDAEVVTIDQRDVSRMSVDLTCDAVVRGAIDLRGLAASLLEGEGGGGQPLRRAQATEQALIAWLQVTDATVVNRPAAMASNNSKPYQAAILREIGFDVPETLVTTDPHEVARFWTDHGTVIYKSISGVRSIVSRVTLDHLDRLERVSWCPTQFQQFVPGRDVRVHVVGDAVFASEVRSDADDYRYAHRDGAEVEVQATSLPADVAERCIAVTRRLGLLFSGVDLRLAPDGRWFAFEVNPSPGFTYYEQHTGQPIASAVADLLESRAGG